MSYKLRNSIALGILLFLIVGIGTYIRAYNLPKKAKQIEKQIQEIDEELQNTPNLVNQFNDLSALLTDTQKRWENRNKDIPPADVTSQSYAYFSRLIDLAVIRVVVPYIYASVALVKVVYDRRLPASTFRLFKWVAIIAVVYCLWTVLGGDPPTVVNALVVLLVSVPLYPYFIRSMEAAAKRKQALRSVPGRPSAML